MSRFAVLFCCLIAPLFADRFFDQKVAPILTKRCLGCHNRELMNGNVSFQDGKTLNRVVLPGKPKDSRLIQTLEHDGDVQMPPGRKLPEREIQILKEWVRRTAPGATPESLAFPAESHHRDRSK